VAKHQNLIQNYGLFWDRRQVRWKGSGAGLYGFPAIDDDGKIRSAKNRGDEVDLRGQVGIYALYDQEFRLLYVGKVGGGKGKNALFVRLRQHGTPLGRTRGLAARWTYFSWFGVLRVLKGEKKLAEPSDRKLTTRVDILNALEAVVIEIAAPGLNRQGGQLGGATEYLQYTTDDADERAEGQRP
jgi:hypothetical protein